MVAAVLASACTRDNPAFEGSGEQDGASEQGTSVGPGLTTTTSASTGPGPNTLDEGEVTSMPTTASTSVATSGLETGPQSEGTSETGPACTLEFPARHVLTTAPVLELPLCITTTLLVSFEPIDGMTASVRDCGGACPCPGQPEHVLSVDVELPPTVPPCARLDLDLAIGDSGDCELLAYALSVTDPFLSPLLVVSNVVEPGFLTPFDLELAELPAEACGTGCEMTPSGYYDLVSASSGIHYPADPEPTPFGVFSLVNEGSGIDEGCSQVARWHAGAG